MHPHADSKNESSYVRIQVLAEFLENHFGEVELHMPDEAGEDQHEQDEESDRDPAVIIRVDEADAYINLVTLVSCTTILAIVWLVLKVVCTRLSLVRMKRSGSASKLYSKWLFPPSARSPSCLKLAPL